MQPHEHIEVVLEHDLELEPAQELTQLQTFVDTLAIAQRPAHVRELLDILEPGARIITPKLRALIERPKVDERLSVAERGPVVCASRRVLLEVKPKRVGGRDVLDRADVETARHRLAPSRKRNHVVNRLQRTGAMKNAGRIFGALDACRDFRKHGLIVVVEPVDDVRVKHGDQLSKRIVV